MVFYVLREVLKVFKLFWKILNDLERVESLKSLKTIKTKALKKTSLNPFPFPLPFQPTDLTFPLPFRPARPSFSRRPIHSLAAHLFPPLSFLTDWPGPLVSFPFFLSPPVSLPCSTPQRTHRPNLGAPRAPPSFKLAIKAHKPRRHSPS
jgi:hypothetical protein